MRDTSGLIAQPRPLIPWPKPGLSRTDFRQLGANGLGDPLNAYPHSMEVFRNKLWIGTTRANLCMFKVSKIQKRLKHWPVKCPDNLYDLDMRAQIHAYDFATGHVSEVMRSPMIEARDGTQVPRELGYRSMTVFQGEHDAEPALYVATYASAKGKGVNILKSVDGATFSPVSKPESFDENIITLRLLVPFKGRLFTSPTGRVGGNPNTASVTVVYETRDPAAANWVPACEPGFGDPGNLSVFEMIACGDYLYAGTGNFSGYQLWRTKAQGDPPYRWERVLSEGAWRGKTNQGVSSLCVFRNALYVGSGIQHGGIDIANKVGPAGPELVRVHEDGSWDIIVGSERDTPQGRKTPLSGFEPGFNSPLNGYFWRMGAHDGWLYVGTYKWAVMLRYAMQDTWPELFRQVYARMGPELLSDNLGGSDLYRSSDGENWVAVTTSGFENPYNYGIRGLVDTPHGLAVGFVNPFGPLVGIVDGDTVNYEPNPRGGLEIWLGKR